MAVLGSLINDLYFEIKSFINDKNKGPWSEAERGGRIVRSQGRRGGRDQKNRRQKGFRNRSERNRDIFVQRPQQAESRGSLLDVAQAAEPAHPKKQGNRRADRKVHHKKFWVRSGQIGAPWKLGIQYEPHKLSG